MTYSIYNFKHSVVVYGHREKSHKFCIAAHWHSKFLSIKKKKKEKKWKLDLMDCKWFIQKLIHTSQ